MGDELKSPHRFVGGGAGMSQIGELVISALGPPGEPLVAALEEVSSRLPPITGEGHAMRIQEPDKRTSGCRGAWR